MLLTGAIASQTADAQTRFQDNFRPFLTRGETSWELDVGLRMNQFDWNIASDITGTQTPNILSEVTWEDVMLVESRGEIRHVEPMNIGAIQGGLHLEGGVSVGVPLGGDNVTEDYLDDNRTTKFSQTDNKGSRGYAIGASAAVGYKIMLTGDTTRRARAIAKSPMPKSAHARARKAKELTKALRNSSPAVSLTPLLGYKWSEQNYKITGGSQTFDLIGAGGFLGDLSNDGLDSEYTAEWYGPFLGIEGEIAGKTHMLRMRGEYQAAEYYAEGMWNLRTDYRQDPSFDQEADGDGYLLAAEYSYALDPDYALTVDAMYHMRTAEDGTSTFHFTTPGGDTTTRLNEVNDKSYALRLGFRHDW